MLDKRSIDPPVSVIVHGKWRLIVPVATKKAHDIEAHIELWNGEIKHTECNAISSEPDEPFRLSAAVATRFGIPLDRLREACAELTEKVRRAMITAKPAPLPGPSTTTALTLDTVANSPDLTPADVVDKDELIKALAELDLVSYDQRREEAAKLLGVRVSTLDAEVTARRRKRNGMQGESRITFDDPEPCDGPVDGAELLDDLAEIFNRFLVLQTGAPELLALWTLFTYAHDISMISPILGIISPEKRCGKTTLLTILRRVVAKPLPGANVTPAVVFRSIERFCRKFCSRVLEGELPPIGGVIRRPERRTVRPQ